MFTLNPEFTGRAGKRCKPRRHSGLAGRAGKRHRPRRPTVEELVRTGYMHPLHAVVGDETFTAFYSKDAVDFMEACAVPPNGDVAAVQNAAWRKYWAASCGFRTSNIQQGVQVGVLLDDNYQLRRALATAKELYATEQDKTDRLSADFDRLLQRMTAITDAFDAGFSYLVRSWQVPAKLPPATAR